jgi:hypothetical protein
MVVETTLAASTGLLASFIPLRTYKSSPSICSITYTTLMYMGEPTNFWKGALASRSAESRTMLISSCGKQMVRLLCDYHVTIFWLNSSPLIPIGLSFSSVLADLKVLYLKQTFMGEG